MTFSQDTTGTADSQAPKVRKTYSQDWPAYNAAQVAEKDVFMRLLADLCSTVEQPGEVRRGEPNLPISDMLFSTTFKVYSGFSARRFSSDVRDAHAKGFIDCTPHFNSVNRYISSPGLTPIIKSLVEVSATPLRAIETKFALDASGFSTCRFDRWFSEKWGKEKSARRWMKAHIAVGVKTNIVTSVEVTASTVHDSVMFRPLLESTAERFTIDEVSADKAYLSDPILSDIIEQGAYPYVPFKSNTTGKGSPMWERLYAYFVLHQDDFMNAYHLRSNVETTFSMIKGKFGDSVRSKSETGQINEVLLKILCHNIVVLVHEMHELGIEPSFRPQVSPEPRITDLNTWRQARGR